MSSVVHFTRLLDLNEKVSQNWNSESPRVLRVRRLFLRANLILRPELLDIMLNKSINSHVCLYEYNCKSMYTYINVFGANQVILEHFVIQI